jgi:hypothetical protein
MNQSASRGQLGLEEKAEKLAKQAMSQGLIPSFVVQYFPDSWVFYIPDMSSDQLTPEEAYLQLKQMLGQ